MMKDTAAVEEEKLRQHYDQVALSGDDRSTALDYNLRELEIELALGYIRDGDVLLDVGCGMAVAMRRYAAQRALKRAVGIDYSANMVEAARQKVAGEGLSGVIDIRQGSVLELPLPDGEFDVVTSHRCMIALLDWSHQQAALRELARVLRPGGLLILLEGTADGLRRLNFFRRMFRLPEIGEGGRDGFERLLFAERELLDFLEPSFELLRLQHFGMYYFLTRIFQPLFVAPDAPRYDHKINDVARSVAAAIPDYENIGQLMGLVLRKRT